MALRPSYSTPAERLAGLAEGTTRSFEDNARFDRAGTGWSESQSGVRDAINIGQQLHLLLNTAGEKPPFVLVSASVAGFYARVYVDRYPAEVAGLVLVDSSTPEQIVEIPGSAYSPALIRQKRREVMLEW